MKAYRPCQVIENTKLAENIYKIKLDIKFENPKPGQFFMFKSESFRNDPLLSRPFGIYDQDDEGLSFLCQTVGKATDLIGKLQVGENAKVLGPLGNGFEIKDAGRIAILAGGIGIAPLLFLSKSLDKKADLYAGFRNQAYGIDEFRPYVDKIVTANEKIENKFILDKFDSNDYDLIYACGPNPMLEALAKKSSKANIQISMEAHMACGIGACLGCTVKDVHGDFIRVCKDGPVFDAERIFK